MVGERLRTESIVRLVLVLVIGLIPACDMVGYETDERLVVSAFVHAGEPLPSISVHRTGALDAPYDPDGEHAVREANVDLRFDDRRIDYRPRPGAPGTYEPADPGVIIPPRRAFEVNVSWQENHVTAASRIPPLMRIDSMRFDVADHAVEAVFADSISRNVRQGYIYPVDVALWWTDTTGTQTDSLHWVHAQINPPESFPSAVLGYFLRTSSVIPEERTNGTGRRREWTGVYGVPVPSDTSSLPSHDVTIFLLRSHTDYARFATSRNTPEQREPVSNVSNGRGIVAGISIDSVHVSIEDEGTSKKIRPQAAY